MTELSGGLFEGVLDVAAAVLGSGGSSVVGAACWVSMRGRGLVLEPAVGGAASLFAETGLTAGAAPKAALGCWVASFCLA